MSYDLEHREIYKLTEAPVKMHGIVVIGARQTVITKTKGEEDFSVSVKTGESELDKGHFDMVRITPAMLAAMR